MSETEITARPSKRRAKGERTRRQILDGVLAVIARDGLAAVTHRAVAEAADVPLSLTTYYFKDLTSLITDAFDHYVEGAREGTDTIWQAAFEILDDAPPLSEQAPSERKLNINSLAELGADYIVSKADTSIGPAIEVGFLYQSHLEPQFASRVEEYQRALEARAIEACRTIGSQAPDTDGALLLGTIQRLEFECLNTSTRPDQTRVIGHLQRIISLIAS